MTASRPRLPFRLARRGASAALLVAAAAGAWMPVAAAAASSPPAATSTTTAPPPASEPAAARPRIGLVLSGGGARGLAHVGVLKVLEELRVPVDVIAGTSMGAIVGGLYASGMRAAELEQALLAVDWRDVFSSRVERPQLSQRRKEEDFEVSPIIELGLRDGELRAPQGAVSSRGLESLLRRYTLAVRGVDDFDRLPIPFRAVATDMESGTPVVLARGDLALALRSSMSVPGVFSPTEVDGRILGDGGLVDNVPVDVARALGADVLIVVNIGTPLSRRQALGTAVGLTSQMINILTEQNVQRSLATLRPGQDVLIAPPLGDLSSGDFAQVRRFFDLGAADTRARREQLAALQLDEPAYAAWRGSHTAPQLQPTRLAYVRIEGTTATNPERLQAMLESKPGQAFDSVRAERDAKRLAAGGDYVRTDYQLQHEDDADGLVFDLEDKPWGPNYLHAGLDLSTDFRGRSAFNLKLSHNRHWLTRNGTEWRNRLQIGEVPTLFSELYHPLAWTASRADDWFVSGYAQIDRRRLHRYDATSGDEVALFERGRLITGADLGQPWGEFGELRLGWSRQVLHTAPLVVDSAYSGPSARASWYEDALRARAVIDQLDYANFPQSGYRAEVEAWAGQRGGDLHGGFKRLEAQGSVVRSVGVHTLSLYGLLEMTDHGRSGDLPRYELGGFHQLSGYQSGQLTGNDVLLLRLTWYRRQDQTPTLTRGLFIGGTIEAGNAWASRSDMKLSKLRSGFSLFLGADTALGPLYLGVTHAPQGSTGLALFIGRP